MRYELSQNEIIFHKPFERHNVFVGDCFASTFILTFDCHSRSIGFFENKILKVGQKEQQLIGEMIREGLTLFEEPLNIMDQVAMKKRTVDSDSPFFGSEQILKNLIEQFLIRLIRSNKAPAPCTHIAEALNQNEHLFFSVAQLLKKNIYKKISLDDISYRAFASRSCIEKVFKKCTGSGVIHYFNQLKMCEAKRLISQGYTITATADKLHFSSVHYFSRLFKQYTNMSPMTYKKSVQAQMLLL